MRNPHFTGRTGMLDQLRQRLHAGEGTLVGRRCTAWAAWAKPSWRSSTPTGSPPTTTGLVDRLSSRCSSPASSPSWAASSTCPPGRPWRHGRTRPGRAAPPALAAHLRQRATTTAPNRLPARRGRACADHLPLPGLGRWAAGSRSTCWPPETVTPRAAGSRSWMIGWPTSWRPSWATYRWPPPRPRLPRTDRPATGRVPAPLPHPAGQPAGKGGARLPGAGGHHLDAIAGTVAQRHSGVVPLLATARVLAPEPICRLFTAHPELLDEPLRTAAADPDAR